MNRASLLGFVFLAGALGVGRAQAELIGVGLDWRSGVFLQEVWSQGKPRYLLANLSQKEVAITVHAFDSKWRLGQPLPPAEAGPWKVPAGQHVLIPADKIAGDALRRFVVGDRPLGVLPGVRDPGYQGDAIASGSGLNGSGGFVPGVYVLQREPTLIAGQTVKIGLTLPPQAGVLKFNRQPEKNADPLRPPSLVVESAMSETLNVTTTDKQITIDAQSPKTAAESHRVVLTIAVPAAPAPWLYMLDGWLARGSGGNGVTRGFWVAPAEGKHP